MTAIEPRKLHEALAAADGGWPKRRWALLDVRELGESQHGHIFSATFLPRRLLEFHLPQLVPVRSTPIVLYDGGAPGEKRAERAAATLLAHGYDDVRWLAGGLSAWREAGYPVQTGWNVPGKHFGEEVLGTLSIKPRSPDDLAGCLEAGNDIVLLDVRTPAEHGGGSLPGSLSAPSFDWLLTAEALLEQHDEVVLHCAGRTRSIIAAATAERLGLDRIRFLENGTMGWLLTDRQLVPGQNFQTLGNGGREIIERCRALARTAGVVAMRARELAERLNGQLHGPIYVFDTRRRQEYRDAHIPGSVWLPGGQACQRSDDFVAIPGGAIVFIDDGDLRAWMAAYWFRQMGFESVFVLEGGIASWAEAGFEMEAGTGRPIPLGLATARKRMPALTARSCLAAMASRTRRPVIIDVGPSARFANRHVQGASWIPRGSLEEEIGKAAGLEQHVIATAWDPDQAAMAAATLADLGYVHVEWLDLPGTAWSEVLPTESGMPPDVDAGWDGIAVPYDQSKQAMADYLNWEVALAGNK